MTESAGGRAQWVQMFEEHRGWLRTVVAGRLGERQAVDDVMQEVALAACSGNTAHVDISAAAPWFYRVAIRQTLLYRRKAGRQRKLTNRFAEQTQPRDTAETDNPLLWILGRERQTAVRRAVAELKAGDRELLMLKYTENWSYQQIAEHLGLGVKTVEYRLFRARKKLRQILVANQVEGTE